MRLVIPGKGVLQGTTLLDKTTKNPICHRFLQVPYCLPPVGPQRWRKPVPLPPSFSYGSESQPGKFVTTSPPYSQHLEDIPTLPKASEDRLGVNIWVPLGKAPENGWPVFFYIHGGFLQYGSNEDDDPSVLISETNVQSIVVSPNYRLGVLGFLASEEICSQDTSMEANFGFWDIRLALEWTHENIQSFDGNADNITVGGLSAGSYAAFHQLAYDIGSQNTGKQIIKRIFMWSNGCGVQPKTISEAQLQFDQLTEKLNISKDLSPSEKLEALRAVSTEALSVAVEEIEYKFIRQVSDHDFISPTLFEDIYSGKFGELMRDHGIELMIGDLTQEFHGYKWAYPPNSYPSLVSRLSWDYPHHIAEAACSQFKGIKQSEAEWIDVFGKLYADIQIHSSMRGFVKCISNSLPTSQIHRYRIDFRTKSVDRYYPPEVGATHATDLSIWFYGNGEQLTPKEKVIVKEWLKPLGDFINGRPVDWGTENVKQVRYLTSDGKIEIRDDEVWDEKLVLWDRIQKATVAGKEENSESV